MNNLTFVCYDISSDKLRRRIDKTMKDFGVRLQYSIFLCKLDSDDVKRCREKLLNVLDKFEKERESKDSVIIIERILGVRVECLLGSELSKNESDYQIL